MLSKRANNIVGIITAIKTMIPPIVGVPAFCKCVWGPSSRISSPIWFFFNCLITYGPIKKLINKEAIAAVLTATLPATTGTVIPANTNFTATDTGLLYYTSTSVTAAAGVATLTLTSFTEGATGNLSNGQELEMARQISGAARPSSPLCRR